MKYKLWFILCIIILFSITACSTNSILPVCNKPYILVETSCCLDQNDNLICDKDEGTQMNQLTSFENTVAQPQLNAKFMKGDIIAEYQTDNTIFAIILDYNQSSDEYNTKFLFEDVVEMRWYFAEGEPIWWQRESIDVESYKIGHIDDLTQIQSWDEHWKERRGTQVLISHVIDGDTIQLSTGEEVRLIGINAPEKGEKCYEESKEFLEDFISGKEITLKKDVEDKDQYGRLLRYVYADEHNVNYGMIYLGYAHKYEYGLNTRYSSWYEEAENKAKEMCGCIWQPCSGISENIPNYITDQCFTVSSFNFNAAGDDNYNLNDEYVTLKNNCDYEINMDEWTIKDETASHIYSFSEFNLAGESSFTLYTGEGVSTNSRLYWGRTSGDYAAIWNNGGDTLYLRDKQGDLVLSKSYEGFT